MGNVDTQLIENPDTNAGSWHNFVVESKLGKTLVASVALLGGLTACGGESSPANDTINPSISTTIDIQGSLPERDYSQITIEAGEQLPEGERITACKSILSNEHGYPENLHMSIDAPIEQILSFHLSVVSDAHWDEDARMLWCVYSNIDTDIDEDGYITAYAYNKKLILAGDTIGIPKGYTSIEEISRDSDGSVEFRWTLEKVLHYQGTFRYVNGIYIADEIFNPEE